MLQIPRSLRRVTTWPILLDEENKKGKVDCFIPIRNIANNFFLIKCNEWHNVNYLLARIGIGLSDDKENRFCMAQERKYGAPSNIGKSYSVVIDRERQNC